MSTQPLRVGTRGSALARWQTGRVCQALEAGGVATDTIEIHTSGDLAPEVPIARLNDPALFTRQLDEAMLDRRIDLAVHSLKDLPTALPAGIVLAAVSAREDARDALVTRDGRGWSELAPGSVIATSSLRRRAQIRRARPDLEVVETRGNVDTRLAKLDRNPDLAATMLAVAGLVRLGLGHRISERLPITLMLPAPGQAALAITAREGDTAAIEAAQRAVHNENAALAVAAERALLSQLEGGCEVPVGAFAEVIDPASLGQRPGPRVIRLRARVVSLDGRQSVEGHLAEPVGKLEQAEALGRALALRLVADGAGRILEELRSTPGAEPAR
ncbi:MAG: hydroxymethylbilane synthase [Gemmatimonadales bacterium]